MSSNGAQFRDSNTRKTPFEVGSKYPHVRCARICTAARFQPLGIDGSPEFVVLNTHLDHRSELQRKLGASLILYRAKYEVFHSECPVFVIGDFNRCEKYGYNHSVRCLVCYSSASSDQGSGAYRILTGDSKPDKVDAEFAFRYFIPDDQLPDFRMIDIRGATELLNICGNFSTFTDFTQPENSDYQTGRIDFIFGDGLSKW